MVAAYLVGFRFVRALPPALLALLVGITVAGFGGQFDTGEARLSFSQPVPCW
jgi:benzoate membrane transport protein